jgi:hypothetical protein
MFFFRPHPIIPYRIPGQTKSISAIDITRRFSVANFVNNGNVTFDSYTIQDGERPDIVAYDYYDDYTQTEYITDDEHELIKLLEEAYKNYVERAFNGSN